MRPRVSTSPALCARALDSVDINSGGSRLLRGNAPEHEALEVQAARFFGAEAALFTGGGYAADAMLLSTSPQRGDLVVHDELIHAGAHEGMRRTMPGRRAVEAKKRDPGRVSDVAPARSTSATSARDFPMSVKAGRRRRARLAAGDSATSTAGLPSPAPSPFAKLTTRSARWRGRRAVSIAPHVSTVRRAASSFGLSISTIGKAPWRRTGRAPCCGARRVRAPPSSKPSESRVMLARTSRHFAPERLRPLGSLLWQRRAPLCRTDLASSRRTRACFHDMSG